MQANIKRDYFWNTLGVLLQNAISPLLLIVVTRVNGIGDSGIFSFAFSVAIIFWVITMWGGRTYQVSDVNQEFPHRSYIMVRLVLTVVAIIGAVLFSVVNHYDQQKTSIILALVLFKAIESVSDAIHGVLQVNDRLYVAGKALTYKAITGFSAFVLVDYVTHDILFGCLGIVLANVVWMLLYDLRKARQLESIAVAPKHVMRVVKNAIQIMMRTWPVFIVIFLSMFSLNIPRYFIDLYHEEQIGYFGILAMPITLIGLVMMFVLQPRVVHLSQLYDQKKYREFKKVIVNLLIITAVIGCGILASAYVFGIPVLNTVFGVNFDAYKLSLTIIVIGGVLNAIVSIFINIFTIIRRFKYQFFILLISNILLAICSASFVQQYGLQGGVVLFTLVNAGQAILLFIAYELSLSKQRRTIS